MKVQKENISKRKRKEKKNRLQMFIDVGLKLHNRSSVTNLRISATLYDISFDVIRCRGASNQISISAQIRDGYY